MPLTPHISRLGCSMPFTEERTPVGQLCGVIDGIAFTGSVEVGRSIVREFQQGAYSRPAVVEMGGKNPAIVYGERRHRRGGGRHCAGGVRNVRTKVQRHVSRHCGWERIRAVCAEPGEFSAGLIVGDPGDREAALGPLINATSLDRFAAAVAEARTDGEVLLGGGRPTMSGYFAEPTVVAGLPQGHRLTREELFVPILTVTEVDDPSAALAEANATPFGLTAGIFTQDALEQTRFLDEIEAGVVFVNRRAGATTGAWPEFQSFCGWKSSGSTGKGGLGTWYLQLFMREQSQTVVGDHS